MRRFRVLQYLAPHATGGIESMARSLTLGLAEQGVAVQVAAMVPPGGAGERWVAETRAAGVQVTVLSPSRSVWSDVAALRRLLEQSPVDLVHAHGYRADILTALLSRRRRPATVATLHGFSPTDWKSRWYSRLDRLALRRFDHVIAVSEPIRATLLRSGIARSRVSVLHNGIDVSPPPEARSVLRAELGLGPEDLALGTVGRLSAEKGHADLLAAFAGWPHPGAHLFFVGDGPERPRLEAMAQALGAGGRVTFLGERGNLERVYPALDVFVLPSHTEGSPTALLEAFAYGIPVIATRVGAVPDMLIDGVEGVLVPACDPSAIAAALEGAGADAAHGARLGEAGRHRYERSFRRDQWLQEVMAVYATLLPSRGGAGSGISRTAPAETGR